MMCSLETQPRAVKDEQVLAQNPETFPITGSPVSARESDEGIRSVGVGRPIWRGGGGGGWGGLWSTSRGHQRRWFAVEFSAQCSRVSC